MFLTIYPQKIGGVDNFIEIFNNYPLKICMSFCK